MNIKPEEKDIHLAIQDPTLKKHALKIYDILIKHYNIPIVIIYARNDGFDQLFEQSKVIGKTFPQNTTVAAESNENELVDKIKKIIDQYLKD